MNESVGRVEPSAGEEGRLEYKLTRSLLDCAQQEFGQDLIEYALVAALVGLGAVTSINSLSNSIVNTFTTITNTLNSAV